VRGDARIAGQLSPALTGVKVDVTLGDVPALSATSQADGTFSFDHVPAGYLARIHAEALVDAGRLEADVSPARQLGAGETYSTVITMVPTVMPVDIHEPDETLAVAATRTDTLVPPAGEARSLGSWKDVDFTPFAVTRGARMAVEVRATGVRRGVFGVSVIRPDGTTLAHANDAPDAVDRVTNLEFLPLASEVLFVRVTRQDREAVPMDFFVTMGPSRAARRSTILAQGGAK
jgi:hypothetical protein